MAGLRCLSVQLINLRRGDSSLLPPTTPFVTASQPPPPSTPHHAPGIGGLQHALFVAGLRPLISILDLELPVCPTRQSPAHRLGLFGSHQRRARSCQRCQCRERPKGSHTDTTCVFSTPPSRQPLGWAGTTCLETTATTKPLPSALRCFLGPSGNAFFSFNPPSPSIPAPKQSPGCCLRRVVCPHLPPSTFNLPPSSSSFQPTLASTARAPHLPLPTSGLSPAAWSPAPATFALQSCSHISNHEIAGALDTDTLFSL